MADARSTPTTGSTAREPRTTPLIRQWLRKRGFFAWGSDDAWIHEDDEGTVMSALDAIDVAISRESESAPSPSVTEPEPEDEGRIRRGEWHYPSCWRMWVEAGMPMETSTCRCDSHRWPEPLAAEEHRG